jgi:hypothetical protein
MRLLAPLLGQSRTVALRTIGKQNTWFLTPQTLHRATQLSLVLFYTGSAMNNSSADARKMERQARRDFFVKNFRYLGDLLRQIVALPSQFIEDDLDSKISVTDFSLGSDIPFDTDLLFFKPFPNDLMEESFKDSSQLQDDRWWPPHDPAAMSQISEPLGVEVNLQRYHEYVYAKWEEIPSGPSLWNGRR